jgi:hypothetical protein
VHKVLVASKADLASQWKVEESEGCRLAARHRMPFFATSAKSNTNVAETFQKIAEVLYEDESERHSHDVMKASSAVGLRGKEQEGGNGGNGGGGCGGGCC